MFSHANLAIFTKSGTLLPLNLKCEIIVAMNDDYDGQAIFYPVTAETEDGSGSYIKGYKKIYGGRFLDNTATTRVAAIIKNGKIDYRNCNVVYERVKTNDETTPIYTITQLTDIQGSVKTITDSELSFPNITFSQKIIFDRVSTELFETDFLYVMAETENPETGKKEYKKVSELAYDNDEVREWCERYRLLFFIDCRNQTDFRFFTVTGDEAIWSDRAILDLLTNTVTVSDSTEARYPMGWVSEDEEAEYSKIPRIDIGFSGEMEGVYKEALHICLLDTAIVDENNIPKIIPIGEIELIAEAEGEDERYRTLFTNFGIPDPKYFDYVYKDSYSDDDKPDFKSINRHSKEMFLEYDKIFSYVGTYRALINAVHLLGYDDIFFKEWYKVLDVSDEIPRGYVAYNMSYKNSGHNATLASLPIEKRIHLRKKNWLSMLYALNQELYGAPDEYDFPYVEELFEYRTEESLLKLIALREWLEKYVLALNCRIIDIGGEGVYFERYAMNAYGGIRMNLEHIAGLNVIPSVEDSSLSDTAVLIDSSAFITVKATAKMEERRIDDLENLRFEDFCDGVITEDGIYHTYDGSLEGRYTGTIFAGFNDRYTAKLNAVSTVNDFIIGEDGFIGEDSPYLIISGNEISFIPEDIVYKEKNTAFKRMPVIALERAVLRSFSDTWEKPIKYLIYPENDPDTGVSYFIENKISRTKVGSNDYVYLVPPTFEEDDESVTITPRNSSADASAVHMKRKHYNFTSDFDASNNVVKEYTSDDTMYGFRFSANNAYEIPLISIQGYSLKRPVEMELPVNNEYYLDIIKGKLIFDDFEHARKIYIIFDTDENGERHITVKLSYFTQEFDLCRYIDAENYTFEHFIEGNNYESFLELYDEDSLKAVEYGLLKSLKVYNSGEFKVNLMVRDVHGEVYSADAYNTAKVITLQPLITAYTNEQNSNNEYAREGNPVDVSTVSDLYGKFCYFWYKTKYPVKQAFTNTEANNITYPNYPYSGDFTKDGMLAHYVNLSDKFKVVAYDKFITHDDRTDWNYYLILNRQNRYKNTRIVEKNDKGALNELYSGDVHMGVYNMAHTCNKLFEDAVKHNSENLDVTVMFYNEVGAFPVIQLPGKILNAKALDNLQAGSPFQGNQSEPYGYFDDEYHLLLSHDITNCYTYMQTDNMARITSIVDASGNYYTAMSFMQDGIEWLVKSLFSEGYGSLWEYDSIPVRMSQENIMGKRYAYSIVDSSMVDSTSTTGYWWTDEGWEPKEFEDLPWISGWLTYKGSPVMTYTDEITGDEFNCQIPAGMYGDSLMFRVPSYDPAFGENAAFFPYYAIKQKTLMDIIPELLDDPNISVYVYPYWHCEVRIIGVSENRVYVQFENSKYKFPRAFKPGELVKLIWQTGDDKAMLTNDISQSSYKVIGYDELGFVLILEGEICGSYAVNPSKKYAYADLDNTSGRYAITKDGWDPTEYEDMPFVDGREGWITGWLTLDGSSFFRHEYDPELSFYKDHPELYRDGSVGTRHTHVFRIPAGMYVNADSSEGTPLIRYRVYSHNDLSCPYADPSNPDEGIDPHGMFSPYYYKFDITIDASLFISYAYNAFSDYKMSVNDCVSDVMKSTVQHPLSKVNDKLTYFIDDTFKATYRTFDVDNGILYWMNSSDNKPLICHNDIYSYNCPVTTYEKTPYTAFNIDYMDIPEDNRQTILWRVYKSLDAKEKTLLFESWNRTLFLDIMKRGIYDIEVNEFDKYGNRAVHMYEGAYRILPEEQEEPVMYEINAVSELVIGEGDYGYITGGGTYEEGTLCILKAVAYPGYNFVGWTIDGTTVDTNNILMFVVSNSCTITALFGTGHYMIDVASNDTEKGDVSISPVGISETNEYLYGTECTLTALPKYYIDYPEIPYSFIKWQKNGVDVSTNDAYVFKVTEDASFTAVFSEHLFKVNAKSENTTYGSIINTRPVCLPGEDCSLTAVVSSSDNYEFIGWYENGIMTTNSSVYYIESVLQDYDMTARFKVKDVSYCTLNVRYNPQEASNDFGIEINGSATLTSNDRFGSIVQLKCVQTNTEDPLYVFNGWYQNNHLLSTALRYNYTLQLPNAVVTAKFTHIKYTVNTEIDSSAYGTATSGIQANFGGDASITVTCGQIYDIDRDNISVTGTCDGIELVQVIGDSHQYIFKVTNVRSNITVHFNFVLRYDYEPFYIVSEQEGGIRVSMNELGAERVPVYFYAMIDGENTVHEFNQNSIIDVPENTKLYIWAQQVKDATGVSRAGTTTGLFIVKSQASGSDCDYQIGGNLISLLIPRILSNSYVRYAARPLTDANKYAFAYMCFAARITDADALILPRNTVRGCYEGMFANSTLQRTPKLGAESVAEDAYKAMFKDCSALNRIITCHEEWTTYSVGEGDERVVPGTVRWVDGVAANGTFCKRAVLETVYGSSFIPNGWSIEILD